MTLKKIISVILDRERSLEERRFIILTLFAALAFFGSTITNLIIHEYKEECIAQALMSIFTLAVLYLSVKYEKLKIGILIMVIEVQLVLMPSTYFWGGGIYGGLIPWFAFSFLYVGMVTTRHYRLIALITLIVENFIFFYVDINHLIVLVPHSYNMFYTDVFGAMFIVGLYIFGVCWLIVNITERESEYAKKQAKEIEELNKSQNRFFSSMSHEIRTPINTIIGLDEMILREDISEEVAEDAINIQAASKMLLTTINDILDMSKIESGKMEIVPVVYSIGDLLSEVVGMVWLKAKEKGLEFKVDVDQTLPSEFLGDEVRIKQILVNVLNNAVKYTEKGSVSLMIRWEKREDGNAEIVFTVSDTGMGIKKESIPYLFTAFKRVDEDKNRYIEGTGLGLSIVKEFVDLMNGEINVNSIYTKGSVFVIKIPQAVSNSKEVGDLMIESRHSIGSRTRYKQTFEAPEARVLIVDDNESNLMVATKLLRDTKVQIDTAMSGEEALSHTIRTKYDVIFMDHLMPEMDGIECLHKVHSQVGGYNKNTPIVALTANAGSELKALYRREGFLGYVLKPVTGELLEAELIKHLPYELVKLTSDIDYEDRATTRGTSGLKKKTIIVTTDSVCDLPKDIVNRYDIPILPYHIVVKNGIFLDGVEAESDSVLSYIAETGESVTTEPPAVSEYEAFFAEQLSKAHSVIHITMAKYASSGYEKAKEAASTFDSVKVVDSGHLAGGLGFVVIYAAKRALEGADVDRIIDELVVIKKRVRTSCFVESTDYLHKAGWISKGVNRVAKTLTLHPVLVLKRSRMKVGMFRIGKREHSLYKYINAMLETFNSIDKSMIMIEYSGATEEELKKIRELVSSKVMFERVVVQKASSTITANCGPGAVGLIYMMER
ncbi:MAG: DegV family EDD domain-containing protein [Lachnospiraceae bacterium]|nr:DegV family EDD domain-containing protein [Lachnospiraceae bacterium]